MIDNRGQALVEYVLIIAIISVITITLVSYFGGYLKDSVTKTACSLVDQEYVKGKKPGDAYCKDKEIEEMQS
ncbi:MAG: hypothetical protein E7158_01050 [Firmicutes bacterium]|nr:hypothetical protein [Bacillota bacterium]